jgi:hypothetical protein
VFGDNPNLALVAIVMRPAILGVQETAQVENIIRNLKERGEPLILISHNMRQVFDLGRPDCGVSPWPLRASPASN